LEDEDRLEPRESPLGEELEELDNESEGRGGEESEKSDEREVNGTPPGNGHVDSDGEIRSDDSMD
jgi:pre-mRNA-splicing factor 38A